MKEKKFKTNTGSVEVYGDNGSVMWNVDEADAKKIGIYVTRKSLDYSVTHIDQGASTELTPNQARKVAERLIAWADVIERNK